MTGQYNTMDNTQFTSWKSPAKLNLFLHILGKRNDGYHDLQSLFQILNFGDDIHIKVRSDDQIRLLTEFKGVSEQDNLIIKAANLLQKASQSQFGCDIKIDKRLPMGGGIGGGSSNAATTLVALNAMWGCDLPESILMDLAIKLGADVPVFVHGKTAFASGVGEHLVDHEIAEKTYLVVNPGVHVSTGMMFSHPELPRSTPAISWQEYQFETTHNDFQSLACQLYPDIANSLHWLLQYAPSRMTGTGACLFGIFDDDRAAADVQQELPKSYVSFIAKGCNTSPLIKQLHTYLQSR